MEKLDVAIKDKGEKINELIEEQNNGTNTRRS